MTYTTPCLLAAAAKSRKKVLVLKGYQQNNKQTNKQTNKPTYSSFTSRTSRLQHDSLQSFVYHEVNGGITR